MANTELYNVVCYGEIAEGHQLNTVKSKLASMFKLNAKQLDALFSGKPLLVKDRIDYQMALKYKAAFERAGAVCRIEPLKQSQKPSSPASRQPPGQPVSSGPQQTPSGSQPGTPKTRQSAPGPQHVSSKTPQTSPTHQPTDSEIPSPLYTISFRGEIVQGKDIEAVKRNLASVFRSDLAQIEKLFTGQPITVQENIDQQTALQYKTAFERAGAICYIMPITAEPQVPVPPPLPQTSPTPRTPKDPNAMVCPKCGFEQPKRLRCGKCGIFIKNYLKNQQQDTEGQQFHEHEEEYTTGKKIIEADRSIERQEAVSVVAQAAVVLFISAAFSLGSTVYLGWPELFGAVVLAALGGALMWFHSRTAAILTFVFALLSLLGAIFTLSITSVLRAILFIYVGFRAIKPTFELHGELADPSKKPSPLAFIVEVALILTVVGFVGFVGYQIYKVTRAVTEVASEFAEMAEKYESMSNLWRNLPDGSVMYAEFEPWPIPFGEPVTMRVWTTQGNRGTKIVRQIDYLLTFSADGFGTYQSMELKESSPYDDRWEATVVATEEEPFLRLRLITAAQEGVIDIEGIDLSKQKE